eukprot:CAMPEP_0194596780 /NCGR_PEP_ID=MMETSP0292-20121207/25886_1 /TAXON_ID=39354 /ORGANISM="Heterosigma akashiwo, Strain CCMP2393" /LENGTH=317 /DNA_ID=CAMNT_0039457153 /DNA_START=194 /DNA_END=1147 /DNA_ORIENTATION=+
MNGISGELFTYCHEKRLVAFKSGSYERCVIFIGGLTDGFMATPYIKELSEMLESIRWSLVQVLLSSSYLGYGISSLDNDAQEIGDLIAYLGSNGISSVILLGHSTGCQDIIRFMDTKAPKSGQISREEDAKQEVEHGARVVGVILQAPVSDRAWLATRPGTGAALAAARALRAAGRQEELLPRDTDEAGAPITARRFLALAEAGGDDDLFTPATLKGRGAGALARAGAVLLCASGADEYVPLGVDQAQLLDQLHGAIIEELEEQGKTDNCGEESSSRVHVEKVILQNELHAINNDPGIFVHVVKNFIEKNIPSVTDG